jgi:hypothetical protein
MYPKGIIKNCTRENLIKLLDKVIPAYAKGQLHVRNNYIVTTRALTVKIQTFTQKLFDPLEQDDIIILNGKYKIYQESRTIEFPNGFKLKY